MMCAWQNTHCWDEAERAELMAELDAAFFHLYGIARDDVEYILSTFKGIHDEPPLFPGVSAWRSASCRSTPKCPSPREFHESDLLG